MKTMDEKANSLDGILLTILETKDALLLVGPAGTGKSSTIRDFCKRNRIGFIDFRASLKDAGDLAMPFIDTNLSRTKFLPPANLPLYQEGNPEDKKRTLIKFGLKAYREQNPEKAEVLSDREIIDSESEETIMKMGESGILFLDEINRANPLVLQALFQLVLDRRIDEFVLLPGWGIVSACNFGDEYSVSEMDPALLDRFTIIYYTGDEACEWLKKNNKLAKAFLEERPLIFDQERIDKQTTPRGLERTIKQFRVGSKLGLSDEELLRMAYGNIQPEHSQLLLDLFKKEKANTWKKLYSDISSGKFTPESANIEDFINITQWEEFERMLKGQERNKAIKTFAKFIAGLVEIGKREEAHTLISAMGEAEGIKKKQMSLTELLATFTSQVYSSPELSELRKIWENLQSAL